VSLSDYKGRVVLVNFWYPKCGPCRGEFPYLQMSLEKYKSQGFEILAINGHPPEDSWVMPLVHGWHLGFIPLKGTEDLLKEYKVRGFPENFLYGADGKIYPMPSQVRPTTLREFQLQVEALLQQANAGGNTAAVAK
jgi:thiol-disulfide isomerase/thioredoxin